MEIDKRLSIIKSDKLEASMIRLYQVKKSYFTPSLKYKQIDKIILPVKETIGFQKLLANVIDQL